MMVLRALRADGEEEKDDEAQSDALDGAEEYGDVIWCENSEGSVMADSSNVWNGSGDDDEKQKVSSNGFQRQY